MKCFDSCISPPSAFLSKMASGEVEVGVEAAFLEAKVVAASYAQQVVEGLAYDQKVVELA